MTEYDKIELIPELPPDIGEAVNDNRLAVFIGAGVSRLVGCMGWNELAQKLVNKCYETKGNDGNFCLKFKEKETLCNYNDHKKTITICHHLLKINGKEDIYDEVLKKALAGDSKLLSSRNIYDDLYGLRGIFVTTNADEHFDKKFLKRRIVYEIDDYAASNIERNTLYHIHGSIKDKSSLIFCLPDYIRRYNEAAFMKFLKKIFKENVVLFVGYGLSEFELLDYVITKYDHQPELPKFLLRHYYNWQDNILKFDQEYYRNMGIKVVGFEIDERGHEQLNEVIKNWNREINAITTYIRDSYKEIDAIVDSYGK